MNTKIGSVKYSITLLDRKEQRGKNDLCPICKNGLGCEKSFAHGRYWT